MATTPSLKGRVPVKFRSLFVILQMTEPRGAWRMVELRAVTRRAGSKRRDLQEKRVPK